MIRLHRNYDRETGKQGIEAVTIGIPGRLAVEIRWRACEDGTTPMLAVIVEAGHRRRWIDLIRPRN